MTESTTDTLDYSSLNPGIVSTVRTLRSWGFNTCDSGDGATHEYDCDLPVPYVHIQVKPEELISEVNRLIGLLGDTVKQDGDDYMKQPNVEASFCPLQHESAFIHLFNIKLP